MRASTILAALAALFLAACAPQSEGESEGAANDNTAVEGPAPALELTGRVVDAASILSDDAEADLTAKLAALEEDTGAQLVVATTPSLDGSSIEAYSLDLANAWGLGNAERNDGLLLLVAPNERLVRIEVGLGLETTVTDPDAAAIIYEAVLPAFRSGDFEAGITVGVDRLVAEVEAGELAEAA